MFGFRSTIVTGCLWWSFILCHKSTLLLNRGTCLSNTSFSSDIPCNGLLHLLLWKDSGPLQTLYNQFVRERLHIGMVACRIFCRHTPWTPKAKDISFRPFCSSSSCGHDGALIDKKICRDIGNKVIAKTRSQIEWGIQIKSYDLRQASTVLEVDLQDDGRPWQYLAVFDLLLCLMFLSITDNN
jgi:hypothetical protein